MSALSLDSICVDCPHAEELAAFYAALLDVPAEGDCIHIREGAVEIWFQEVENYQAPTWPTQERGQQVHFDISTADIEATTRHAIDLGATLTEPMAGYHSPILIDPVGHPFCLINDATASTPTLSAVSVDCANHQDLAAFYAGLVDGELEECEGWTNLNRDGFALSFQTAEGYLPPTWPTQERGQQMHFDFHTSEREVYVARAIELGAEVAHVAGGFTVMKDPAGHPFCICNPQECELGK